MDLRVGQWFAVAAGVLGTVAVTGIVVGVVAVGNLSEARERLNDELVPAQLAFEQAARVVVDQETGVRGYVLTGRPSFLEPYTRAVAEQELLSRRLAALLERPSLAPAREEAEAVGVAAAAWQDGYAKPSIAAVRRGDPEARTPEVAQAGKARFDALRRAIRRTLAEVDGLRREARQDVLDAARTLNVVFAVFGSLLLLSGIALAVLLRQTVTAPIGRLTRQARVVAGGRFEEPVTASGPRDVRELGEDVDHMRRRILEELRSAEQAREVLDAQRRELERSNAELEQFAYVASHDLQEPLRKVASFTQLLERRYKGQLDERADQYIEFAVDGAKRMQVLINDLLAFSRVGRIRDEQRDVDLDEALSDALANLQSTIEETGATVEADPLPTVRGEPALLTAVFQNLVGNGMKFRREGVPPVVRIGCRRDGDVWELAVADNGIGIDAEYAERIFVIFQRLHTKEEYAGTGIGLAMCRKIVEHHGGRIWLDTEVDGGTTFRFTLPAMDEEPA